MNPTPCPKCGGKLELVTYAGIEVDRCLYCEGIWFDSFEIEKLKEIKGSECIDTGDPQTGSQFDNLKNDIDCPRCHQKMIRMVDIDRHLINYEQCFSCQGVWLDAGEFRKFKANFNKGMLHRAKQVFKRR